MRHSVNIFFGKKTSDCLLALHKYMLRSAEGNARDFFRSYLYSIEDKEVSIKNVELTEDGECTLADVCNFATSKIGEEIPKFVLNTHRQTVTIHNKGDFANLHLCIYIPLLEDVKQVTAFLDAIEKGGFNYVDIDVIGLAGDLCKTISPEYGDKSNLLELQKISGVALKHLVDYRKQHVLLQHLLCIQDYQNGGASLSLQLASLTRILGEFSLMMIEDYIAVYGNIRSESDFQTIGLSMLQLDRYYFQEYMLRKSLKEVAEREKIEVDQVDINMATKRADDLLRPWMSLLQETYRKEVKSALERGETENEVVAKIDDYLNDQFEKMRTQLESYITDDKLSLPEKKAILSAVLGQDDELFVNDLFDEEMLNFNDLEREAIGQFTSTNNYILKHEDHVYDALLSENEEEATYPIDRMRKNRIELRRTMCYIRELTEEQKRLEQQMNLQEHAKDCFIGEGGFTIGEHTYKLLPKIDDEPLQDDYTPHTTQVPSVDLSGQMPRIKNQGSQGACLAFSLTSIFEYMYKNMTQQNIDLSEQFLYYTARELAGETDKDEGLYLKHAVNALAEKGICVEDKWPYGKPETAFNIKPTEEAYQEAKDRILAQAKNVKVDVNAIRSALSDGNPVVISARLYDSFGMAQDGYVPMPTEEERKAADDSVNRHHAMVIVGYNDEVHAFKVRNSWGEDFGMGGYVLMPYAYVEEQGLISYAAIVTEIRLASTITEKVVIRKGNNPQQSIPRLEFDTKDTRAQYGINKIMLDDAKAQQRKLEEIDSELTTYCLNLKQKLKNPNIRQQMRKAAAECYETDIAAKEKELNQVYADKSSALDDLEHRTRRHYIWTGLVALLVTIFFITTAVIGNKYAKRYDKYSQAIETYDKAHKKDKDVKLKDPFTGKEYDSKTWMEGKKAGCLALKTTMGVCHAWWLVTLVYMGLCGFVLYVFIVFKREKRDIVELYDDKIQNLSKEKGLLQKALDELGIKFYLAGTMLTQFFTIYDQLETKSNILKSFLVNTNALSKENEQILNKLNPNVQPPFIPMLKNEELDTFFDKNSGELAVGTRLYHFFEGYTISNDAFHEFQDELKQRLNTNLDEILKDFSMYKYMSGQVAYKYLSSKKCQITDFLIELDEKSEVFMLCNDTSALNPSKALYLHTDPNEEMVWQSTYRRAFSSAPVCVNIDSRFKILLLRLLDLNLKQVEWYTEAK